MFLQPFFRHIEKIQTNFINLFLFIKFNKKKKKLLLLLLTVMMGISSLTLSAQNTLTVADGTTTNSNVPIQGLWADAYLRCQTIYTAAALDAAADTYGMNGGTITGLTYYLSSPAAAGRATTARLGPASQDRNRTLSPRPPSLSRVVPKSLVVLCRISLLMRPRPHPAA